jgi:hypothetical protein
LPLLKCYRIGKNKVNPHQQVNLQCGQLSAARNRLNEQRLHPSLNSSAENFDIWWQRVFAHHAVIAARASALMRAHRRFSASGESHVNQAD